MDWDQIRTWAIGLAVSAFAAVVGKWFGVKIEGENRSKLTWALEQGVALAAERLRAARNAGEEKKKIAIETAQSLAPGPMRKLKDDQKSALVDATYARMRASLPHGSTFVTHGDALDHQTERIDPK